MYFRALIISHKQIKPSHFHDVIEKKELFASHSKENHFVVKKMLNFLIIVLLHETENYSLSYSTLNEEIIDAVVQNSFRNMHKNQSAEGAGGLGIIRGNKVGESG